VVLGSLQLNKLPGAAAVGDGSLWVIDYAEGSISQVEAATNRLRATIQIGDPHSLPPGCGPGTVHDAPYGSFPGSRLRSAERSDGRRRQSPGLPATTAGSSSGWIRAA